MLESHDSPGVDSAARASVFWAVIAGIATATAAAYAFALWGGSFFPAALGQPFTEEIAAMERWPFAAASATFGFLALLPLLVAVFAILQENARLMRELSGARKSAGVYANELVERGEELSLHGASRSIIEDDLHHANRAAEKANKAKSEFLANISHELRTPMNVVAGLADVLSRSTLSARQRRFVDSIRCASRSLLAQIDDILDFSRFDSENIALRETDINLRGLIAELAPPFAELAQQKSLEFSIEIGEDVPTLVHADGRRLRKVLTNLLTNAVKFTHRGSVALDVSFKRLSGEGGMLRVDVSDTGIGISEEEKERIFQAFEQADDALTRSAGGTGLGLAIARKLVQLMDGTIGVESSKDKGSVFTVVVPMAISRAGASSEAHDGEAGQLAADPGESGALPQYGLKILLAEDSAVNREVALEHLSSLGCGADVAVDGLEAVEAFRRKSYDVVLMDCQMPRCDGYEATRRIRALEKTMTAARPVPIVALTAHAMPGDREKCLSSGMSDYIAKPYALEDLTKCFDRWCPEAGNAEAKDPRAHRGSPLDSTVAQSLRTEKPALWGRLKKAFLLQAGPARQSLLVALAGADFDTVKAVAHSFKSACANVGALELSDLCRRLEAGAIGKDKAACADYGARFEAEMDELCRYLENEQGEAVTPAAKIA